MYSSLDEKIINICNYEYDNFLCKKNVVGVGLGYKEIKGIDTCEKSIIVMVKRKVSLNDLSKEDRITSYYNGIRTDVVEVGVNRIKSLTDRIRPVLGGYGIGPAGIDVSGTYGGLVTDGVNKFILSNNHILAVDNLLPIGNSILQPSASYGGYSPRDVVAKLSKFVPIKFLKFLVRPVNYVDAAIAIVRDEDLVSPEIKFIGIPTGVISPVLKMNVQMTGEISEYLSGKIKYTNASLDIEFTEDLSAIFNNQILFSPLCDDGDSGALVLDMNNKVVGLNFAGNEKYSIANPIDRVLNSLNVQLVTQ